MRYTKDPKLAQTTQPHWLTRIHYNREESKAGHVTVLLLKLCKITGKAAVHMFVYLLFYATTTVFQLFHGGNMMYEMRRKPEPSLLPTMGIFNFPHQIGMK